MSTTDYNRNPEGLKKGTEPVPMSDVIQSIATRNHLFPSQYTRLCIQSFLEDQHPNSPAAPPRQTKTEEVPPVAVSSSLSISPRGRSKSNIRSASEDIEGGLSAEWGIFHGM
jgi:hypothetical protein